MPEEAGGGGLRVVAAEEEEAVGAGAAAVGAGADAAAVGAAAAIASGSKVISAMLSVKEKPSPAHKELWLPSFGLILASMRCACAHEARGALGPRDTRRAAPRQRSQNKGSGRAL